MDAGVKSAGMSSLRLRVLATQDGSLSRRNDGAALASGPERDQVREWQDRAPREVRIGRHPDNDLELPYAGISALHARLFQKGEGRAGADAEWWLEDLGSSNGTWMGDTRLRPGVPHLVNVGAAFRVGALSIELQPVARAGALESTATMGRRLIVDGLAPPSISPRTGPQPTAFRPGPDRAQPHADAGRPPAPERPSARRPPVPAPGPRQAPGSASRGIVVAFAIGMTVLAVSGLIALALALR